MSDIRKTIKEIDALTLDGIKPASLDLLASEIENDPEGKQAIEPVLRLFERYPEGDFGTPGPLAHAIECYYGNGYEELLLKSVSHTPTILTLWLANRVINANDHNRDKFLAVMLQIENDSNLSTTIRDEASSFLGQHNR